MLKPEYWGAGNRNRRDAKNAERDRGKSKTEDRKKSEFRRPHGAIEQEEAEVAEGH
jgi:hypothetical protein